MQQQVTSHVWRLQRPCSARSQPWNLQRMNKPLAAQQHTAWHRNLSRRLRLKELSITDFHCSQMQCYLAPLSGRRAPVLLRLCLPRWSMLPLLRPQQYPRVSEASAAAVRGRRLYYGVPHLPMQRIAQHQLSGVRQRHGKRTQLPWAKRPSQRTFSTTMRPLQGL